MEGYVDLEGHFRHLEPDRESKLGEGGEGEPLQVADDQLCLPRQESKSEAFGKPLLVQ